MTRAKRLYPRSVAFRGAYVRGARAAAAGAAVDACPYSNRTGWTAWRRAWIRGWQSLASND